MIQSSECLVMLVLCVASFTCSLPVRTITQIGLTFELARKVGSKVKHTHTIVRTGREPGIKARYCVLMQDVVREYGADTVRVFMLFKAPPELDIQWDIRGSAL